MHKINWLLAKEKPVDWCLPWKSELSKENKFYQPNELISDKYEDIVGCVSFLMDSKITGGFLKSQTIDDYFLVDKLIQQLNLLINLVENSKRISSSNLLCQIEQFFRNFYAFLQEFSTENKEVSFQEKTNRLEYLRRNLPSHWIYCRDNVKSRFSDLFSVAFNCENPVEPFIQKLPSIYFSGHHERHFFHSIGVKEHFTLSSLKDKLKQIQNISKGFYFFIFFLIFKKFKLNLNLKKNHWEWN